MITLGQAKGSLEAVDCDLFTIDTDHAEAMYHINNIEDGCLSYAVIGYTLDAVCNVDYLASSGLQPDYCNGVVEQYHDRYNYESERLGDSFDECEFNEQYGYIIFELGVDVVKQQAFARCYFFDEYYTYMNDKLFSEIIDVSNVEDGEVLTGLLDELLSKF